MNIPQAIMHGDLTYSKQDATLAILYHLLFTSYLKWFKRIMRGFGLRVTPVLHPDLSKWAKIKTSWNVPCF